MTSVLMIPACEPEVEGTQTEKRLIEGLKIWEKGCFDRILVCGGRYTSRQTRPAARLMGEWLKERGVPAERIIYEGNSRDTFENVFFSLKVLPLSADVYVVSHWQHAIRIWMCFRKHGKQVKTFPLSRPFVIFKEFLFLAYHVYDPYGNKPIARKNRRKRTFSQNND